MEKLRQWLESTKTPQHVLAERLHVTQAAVSLWVTGEVLPTGSRLKKISEATGLSFDDLLGKQPQPPKKKKRVA